MRRFVIYVKDNDVSERGRERLLLSTSDPIESFQAPAQEDVYQRLKDLELRWNYPWEGEQHDMGLGLVKRAYPTKVRESRISCALSHYHLWGLAFMTNEPIMILEHDAIFVNPKIPEKTLLNSEYDIIGLNDPRGATRRSQVYHEKIQEANGLVTPVPTIDEPQIPQGLAGNSAYIIKPVAGKKLIELAQIYGLWPNDALMCKQLVPNMGVTTEYYTKVQGLRSTTTQ